MTFWSIAPITIVASVATFAAIHENYFIQTRNNMRKIVTLVCALVVTSCWAQEPISDSTCKALMDRTVSFNSPLMYVDSDGIAHHYGYEEGTKKTVLISTAGLPNMKGNFDGLLFAIRHMYGKNISYICCAEGSLFLSPDTESLTVPYLEKVKQAGAEYRTAEKISDETQAYLDTPMLPAETFVKTVNGIFESMISYTVT